MLQGNIFLVSINSWVYILHNLVQGDNEYMRFMNVH
jgi:hypothetical protein